MSRCLITGLALATALGANAQATWQNLLSGSVLRGVGRVPVVGDASLPRVSQLAVHVARDALADAGWSKEAPASDRTALVIGTSKGPIEAWLAGQATSAFGLAAVAEDVAAAIGHTAGPRLTSSAACASGLHALIRAKELLDSGRCDRALIVAAESSIGPLFQATFTRLGVLARPEIGCRPFDKNREGFLLAEAAAAVCLEREAAASKGGIELAAGVLLSDAHHLTAPDPAGAAVEAAVRRLTVGRPVQLVHAHGTGTVLNDPAELDAISRAVASAQHPVAIVSHKHAIGHTQGAAGLISVVLNVLIHRNSTVFGNANSPEVMPNAGVEVPTNSKKTVVAYSIALAAGFGGPIAAVRLEGG